MEQPAKILVILDKPKHPQVALDRAVALARAADAHLHLVSFCWLAMVERKEVFDTHQRRAIRKSATAERRRWLDGLILDAGLTAADISTEIAWTRDIAGWVAEKAPAGDVDLVVKSVHRSAATLTHTPLDWALLRSCPRPLLLVSTRRPAGNAVLATVDLDSTDARHRRLNRRVVDAAARYAAISGGPLHCATVVESWPSFEDLEFFDERKMAKRARDSARDQLAELLSGYGVAKNRQHLATGKVGQAVLGLAEQIPAGTVVVGTGTHRALGAMLLGSSAEKILARADCDILAVHV